MKYHVSFDLDFKRNPYKGRYIAIEGIDGSGKTFQTEKVAEYFQKIGKTVVTAREPRKEEGVLGELIQKILRGQVKMSPIAMQYIFTADRILNQEEIVLPALKAGKIVISDRSFWSIIPYALPDMGANFSKSSTNFMLIAQGLLSMYHQSVVPDTVFYLDVSVNTAMQRLSHKKAEKEIYEKREKVEKHFKGYNWLLKHFPKEFISINGEKESEIVTAKIIKKLKAIKT